MLYKPVFVLSRNNCEEEQPYGCGIPIGSLFLLPDEKRIIEFRESMKKNGFNVTILRTQLSFNETEELRDIVFIGIRKRIEGLLRLLDRNCIFEGFQIETLIGEVKWMKEVLASYQISEEYSEIERVNDLADVLISRFIEVSRVQVLEVVKIED